MRTEGPWNLNDVQYWSNKGMWALPPKGSYFQGGYYIADITYADGRKFGLILAQKNYGGSSSMKWKTVLTITPNTGSNDDGFANSEAMITADASMHPAGNFCRTLSIGGYTDWYLPARNELTTIFNNRNNIPTGEGFTQSWYYWSSTSTSYTAWTMIVTSNGFDYAMRNFDDGF